MAKRKKAETFDAAVCARLTTRVLEQERELAALRRTNAEQLDRLVKQDLALQQLRGAK
jgi:hypothetical protein